MVPASGGCLSSLSSANSLSAGAGFLPRNAFEPWPLKYQLNVRVEPSRQFCCKRRCRRGSDEFPPVLAEFVKNLPKEGPAPSFGPSQPCNVLVSSVLSEGVAHPIRDLGIQIPLFGLLLQERSDIHELIPNNLVFPTHGVFSLPFNGRLTQTSDGPLVSGSVV